jgi:hypothetical protein
VLGGEVPSSKLLREALDGVQQEGGEGKRDRWGRRRPGAPGWGDSHIRLSETLGGFDLHKFTL